MEKSTLQEPLRLLQLLNLDDTDDARVAFHRLGIPPPDLPTFVNAIRAILRSLPSTAMARPEWQELQFNGERYVWGGPTHLLRDGEGRPVPPGLIEAIRATGRSVRQGYVNDPDGAEASKGYAPLFLVDKWEARHWLWTKDRQALYVKAHPDAA